MDLKESVKEFIEIVKSSGKTYALTGAGVSTPSGIPDFRGRNGLYKKIPPDTFDIEKFFEDPERYYRIHRERISLMAKARPNVVHKALALMESKGMLDLVVTQNIDGLHQKAGSKNVVELHGNISRYVCTECGAEYEEDEVNKMLEEAPVPKCRRCGGIIKPKVVFFGEALPEEALSRAFREAEEADLALAIGTSLVVYPAALLPKVTVERGGKMVIINMGETGLDGLAFRKYEFELSEFFGEVMKELEQEG